MKLSGYNEFISNLSLFDQNETSSFSLIQLDGYWLNFKPFKSEILINQQQLSPLYRGTRDGFGSDVFHSKCDGHSNTLTIFKARGSSYIFGGFTTADWVDESSGWPGKNKTDPNAFIFSLINKDNVPLKMKIQQNKHQYAFQCHSRYGPIFGGGDIGIANNSNTTTLFLHFSRFFEKI